ncbi:MAG: malto-oligosyltrehalose synthase [Candidatus Dormibacteria bacterium]
MKKSAMPQERPGLHAALGSGDRLVASYRVQLRGDVDFAAAGDILPYLAQLGVSHLYLSPFLTATPGSSHGYDITDPTQVDPELGGRTGFDELVSKLKRHGLDLLVDLVPNHMAVSQGANSWWQDLLSGGRDSSHAGHFDVDWDSSEQRLGGRVLLPFLPRSYGRMLSAGEFRLVRVAGGVEVRFAAERYPLTAASLLVTLEEVAADVPAAREGLDALARAGIQGSGRPILGSKPEPRLAEWPVWTTCDQTSLDELDRALAAISANPVWLDRLLSQQHYRLARWQATSEDRNYRRFFDVDSMVGLRMEEEKVHGDHHRYLLGLLDSTAGLRVDHPDGLRDPELYLRRLRQQSEQRWIVVEKILAPGEDLPSAWPVQGTTGYEFSRLATGLFVDQDSEESLTRIYSQFTGEQRPFAEIAHISKVDVVRGLFGSDLNRLTNQLLRLTERDPFHRDCTRSEAKEVLAELASALPVYRTYLRERMSPGAAHRAAAALREALDGVATSRPDLDPDLVQFAGEVLSLRVDDPEAHDLALRFQQLTGAVMAKGVEDTAFYRYHRLISLNEVGDDPSRFGVGTAEFHRSMAWRQARHPFSSNATSTHDSKRSEDVRCRINAISEVPNEWARAVRRWSRLTARHRVSRDLPDRNFEYFLYQTLVGAWPISEQRLLAVVEKSVREAKVHTSWRSPQPTYETAVRKFVIGSVRDPEFVGSLAAFVRRIDRFARISSLAVTLLKVTAPGVPDIYQGTEVWHHSLVDPDNRRAVDFARLREQLARSESASLSEVVNSWSSGLPKQWLLARGLRVRREFAFAMGASGDYLALEATGELAKNVVAFQRGEQVVTVAPRLPMGARRGWGDTAIHLHRGNWVDRLSGARYEGGETRIAGLLGRFPVALLVAEVRA